MAKVVIDDDCIDIRVSLVERMTLAQRPRKLPLSRVRGVNPHPPLLDLMVHWAHQSSAWLGGVSSYEGHMIPSTRNPKSTLAIELEDEPQIFIEIDDDEPTEQVAARISRAIGSEPPPPPAPPSPEVLAQRARRSDLALEIARAQALDEAEDELDEEVVARQRRDPLGQGGYGSLPPPALRPSEAAAPLRLERERNLARLGGWLVALGSVAVITGGVIVAAGAVPGLVAVGVGIVCGAFGGVALGVVAHHKG